MKINHSKVLIVDNSKTYLTFARSVLENAGYQVLITANVWINKLINSEKPDLILMDLSLGHSNGVSVVSAVKNGNFGSGIKIYLHSAESVNTLSNLCLECGADGFISKNGDGASLLQSVEKALKSNIVT